MSMEMMECCTAKLKLPITPKGLWNFRTHNSVNSVNCHWKSVFSTKTFGVCFQFEIVDESHRKTNPQVARSEREKCLLSDGLLKIQNGSIVFGFNIFPFRLGLERSDFFERSGFPNHLVRAIVSRSFKAFFMNPTSHYYSQWELTFKSKVSIDIVDQNWVLKTDFAGLVNRRLTKRSSNDYSCSTITHANRLLGLKLLDDENCFAWNPFSPDTFSHWISVPSVM